MNGISQTAQYNLMGTRSTHTNNLLSSPHVQLTEHPRTTEAHPNVHNSSIIQLGSATCRREFRVELFISRDCKSYLFNIAFSLYGCRSTAVRVMVKNCILGHSHVGHSERSIIPIHGQRDVCVYSLCTVKLCLNDHCGSSQCVLSHTCLRTRICRI